jgi:hypothetical protein
LLDALTDTGAPLKRQVVAYTLGLLASRSRAEVQGIAQTELLKLVEDDDWRVRFFATDLLGATGEPAHLAVITKRLHDEVYAVHCAAARGLGRTDTDEAAHELVKELDAENSSHGQIGASLVFLGPVASQPIVEGLQIAGSADAKLTLLTALTYLGDPRSLRVFQESLHSEDPRQRAAAVKGLAALGYPGSLDLLLLLLKEDLSVQPAAVDGLVSNVLWGRVSREQVLDSIGRYVPSPLGYQQEAIDYLKTGEVAFENWHPLPQLYTAFVYQLDFDEIAAHEINYVLGEPASDFLSFDLANGVRRGSRVLWREAVRRKYHELSVSFSLDKHGVAALVRHLDARDLTLGERFRDHLKSCYCRVLIPHDLFLCLAEVASRIGMEIDQATASAVKQHIEKYADG